VDPNCRTSRPTANPYPARVLIADLRHYLDTPHLVPGHARSSFRLAAFLGNVVRVGTTVPAGPVLDSALPCRRRPGRQRCAGWLRVRRLDVPAVIEWSCPACGDAGQISNWRRSPHDLRVPGEPGPDPAQPLAELLLSREEVGVLQEMSILDRDGERLVWRARPTERGIVLDGAVVELKKLAGFVAAEARQEGPRHRRRRLGAVLARLEQALGS
jgi:hypothetical protein